jgi:pimeloyl-ACP methyl ester carboxylesterase
MSLLVAVVATAAVATWLAVREPPRLGPPVVFVHGMGASAADMGTTGGQFDRLLPRLAEAHPHPGVCMADAQSDRPWDGSPCVFRYVEDAAAGGDSQSGVEENAEKLAKEVAEVHRRAGGRRVVLVGYSMGGTIVRAYLGLHAADAGRLVASAVLIDPATAGSWGYALDVRERFDNPVAATIAEALSGLAADIMDLDLDRPAFRDLRPRNELYRRLAALPLPRTVSYYTFWGDARLVIRPLPVDTGLPQLHLEVGDLWLLPGDPDPARLPDLGGQRLRPPVDAPAEALEIRHRHDTVLDPARVALVVGACLDIRLRCLAVLRSVANLPAAHWRIPFTIGEIRVDHPAFGQTSLEDAVIRAVGRSEGG